MSNFMRVQGVFFPFCEFFLSRKKKYFYERYTKNFCFTPVNLSQCSKNAQKGQKQQICEKIQRQFIVHIIQNKQRLYVHNSQISAIKELKRCFSSCFSEDFKRNIFVKKRKNFSAREKNPHSNVENFTKKSTRCCAKAKKITQNNNLCGKCGKV